MRARTLALGLTIVAATLPVVVYAAPVFLDQNFNLDYPPLSSDPSNPLSQVYKTAFRDGDQGALFVALAEPPDSTTTVSANLGALAASSSVNFFDDNYTFVTHGFLSPNFTVQAGGITGPVSFTITATASDGSATTITKLANVDNLAPTFSITSTRYQYKGSTDAGDTLFLTGSVDGTGSPVRMESVRIFAETADGGEYLESAAVPDPRQPLPNGAFTDLSFTSIQPAFGPQSSPPVSLRVDFVIADGAENTISLEKIIPLPPKGASSVLFLPGIEGSILSSNGQQLWPPANPAIFSDTLDSLALNVSGQSISPVTVNGIVNTFYTASIYSGFSSYMDGLVAAGTIKSWEPLAYDWRYSPSYIIANGIQTLQGTTSPVAEVEKLAASSATGKVTIVGHSYGGLIGKALIKALADKGEANLVDNFVMVGTPQLGTPQAATGLLEGENQAIPGGLLQGFIVNASSAQDLGLGLESAYDLLPSKHYFDVITDPIIDFDQNSSFTQAWRDYFGQCVPGAWCINSYNNFQQFLTGSGVSRDYSLGPFFNIPAVLQPNLLAHAQAFHDQFDNFVFPPNIHVIQVAGWGLLTTKAIEYQNTHFIGLPTPIPGYETPLTREGDEEVVYTSALSSATASSYFFNLTKQAGIEHRNLPSAPPIEDLITSILKNQPISDTQFVTQAKPAVGSVADELIVATHSPVLLGAKDSQGNFTGVNPGQSSNSQFLFTSEGIPGSTFLSSGGSEYILLPENGSYTFTFQGDGSGPATVTTGTFSGDTTIPAATYSDIPVTPVTQATFVVDSAAPADTHIQVDQNGDGQPDTYVAPDGGTLSLNELLTNLTTAVNTLTIKDKQKTQLLNKISNIQGKIAKQAQKQSTALSQLKAQVSKQAGKGKIDTTTANALSSLLDTLITQDASIPLDPTLIQQLKDQINVASITTALKTSLLNKVVKLENLSSVNKSLNTMIMTVTNKGARGVLSDTDAQNLLNLLDQIISVV